MSQEILIRPIVTEKMTGLAEGGHYAFEVDKRANKLEIRKAVEARYPNVKIKEVRTMIQRGKFRRQLTRRGAAPGRRASIKKAIVTLEPGSPQIDFYENV